MSFEFICGTGYKDTKSKSRGRYLTTTFADIVSMAKEEVFATPCHSPKDHYWFIPVVCNEPDARSLVWHRDQGHVTPISAFWIDIDRGSRTFEDVVQLGATIAQGHEFLAYTSRSHGEVREVDDKPCPRTGHQDKAGTKKCKYRLVFPLAVYADTRSYKAIQRAVRRYSESVGFIYDDAALTATQVCYAPNAGVEYRFHHQPGERINLSHHWLLPYIQQEVAAVQEEERVRLESRNVGRKQSDGAASLIKAYRDRHPTTPEMLEWLGFESYDGVNWKLQGGSSFATELYPDGALYTRSSTVGGLGGISDGNGGWYFNDTYYLYMNLKLDGNAEQMRAYAQQCRSVNIAPFVEHGRQVWEAMQAEEARKAEVEAEAQRKALEEYQRTVDRGFTKYTILGPLTGFTEQVAHWVEHKFMHFDQPEIAKIAALVAVASFVGRKDNFLGAAPVVNCLTLGITGIGKNVVNQFVDKVMQGLEIRWPSEFGHGTMNHFERMGLHEGIASYNKSMAKHLSGVILLSEAGLARDSSAGDRSKVQSRVMQNIASDAYSRLAFTEQSSNHIMPVWGVPHSVFEESTMEAMKKHINNSSHQTGEAARRLFYYLDVSRGNTAGRQREPEIPTHLLEGFYYLAKEALRAEEAALGAQDKVLGSVPGTVIPDFTQRISYQPDQEVAQAMEEMYEEARLHRMANTDNVADIDWGHKNGRSLLLLKQLSLLLARTDRIALPELQRPPVVTMEEWRGAERLVMASLATEKANSSSFGNPLDDLCLSMLETCARLFGRGEPNKKYVQECGSGRDYKQLFMFFKVPWTYLVTVRSLSKKAGDMVNASYTKVKVWEDVKKHGVTLGYWEESPEGRKLFLQVNIDKLKEAEDD